MKYCKCDEKIIVNGSLTNFANFHFYIVVGNALAIFYCFILGETKMQLHVFTVSVLCELGSKKQVIQ